MLDVEKCTLAVCEIARRAGAYIRGEREKFSLESVERKHAHDYVSYVDKGWNKPHNGDSLLCAGWWIRWTVRRTLFISMHLML